MRWAPGIAIAMLGCGAPNLGGAGSGTTATSTATATSPGMGSSTGPTPAATGVGTAGATGVATEAGSSSDGVDPDGGSTNGTDPTGTTGGTTTGASGTDGSSSGSAASCDERFGAAPDYILCLETETECHFNATTGGGNCNEMCSMLMSTCLGAFDNPNSAGQECDVIEPNTDTCDTNRSTEICVCSK